MTITADATAREVEPTFVPDVAIRGFRWVMDDSWKDQLVEGLVVKVEVVLRLEGLVEFGDGTRWKADVLEVGRTYD